ncbi:unnamed protein product [Mytilus coruscus]|uniref:Uncharacterized protein n=1 Tax=Mytilus coruscus TaxID=42192 RepID=A0A6J8BF29_MYTCO|nr:unnamed protein product [Mytilus coruscus]
MMELDFSGRTIDKQPISREDKRFLNILQDGIRRDEGHYELPLPFKGSESNLPNDKSLALQRFEHLRKHTSSEGHKISKDFYVDDGLKSVSGVGEAVRLVKASQQMCSKGGLRLHKFRSNSKEVLKQIPPDDQASDIKNIDLLKDELPTTKTLGVQWCIESDSFQFHIVLNDKPLTRRGILSTLSCLRSVGIRFTRSTCS